MVACLLLAGVQLHGQALEQAAKAFLGKPTAPNRAAVEKILLRHPKDAEGALARLVLFHGDTSAGSIEKLKAARPYLLPIADYVDWMVASTAFASKDYEAAIENAEAVLRAENSPVAPRAALVALKSAAELQNVARMEALLAKGKAYLTPAQFFYYSGRVASGRNQAEAARKWYAQTLKEWPRTAEAGEALQQLPLASLTQEERLERANRLLEQGDPGGARAEYVALLPSLEGKSAELARVRIGVCEYRLRRATAWSTLQQAKAQDAEAEAERLFFALLAARRAKNYDAMAAAVRELSASHPKSSYRLEGLANAASEYWVMGETDKSLPLYEACALDFANEPAGQECEWKVAVRHYILGRPGADKKLEAILRRDPGGEHASAALYFLGRNAEGQKNRTAAKSYYRKAIDTFPNHFYAELCRERIATAGLQAVDGAASVEAMLKQLEFPSGVIHLNFEANAMTKKRIARADLLARGALYDYAELELRHQARGSEQAHLLAIAAASMATRRGVPDQGIRYVKSIFPGYLNLPINTATLPLWKVAYPIPFKDPLLTHSYTHSVDPYLLAGLVRQESEFAPRVISRSNARGLAQIMPATGRDLARRLKIKGFTTGMLFDPSVNLRMGSYYLRSLIDSLGGNLAQALASYNAGRGRVTQWLKRGEFADPAEFVESIPFNETRGYVQSVIRNAGIYKRLYGEGAVIEAAPGLPSKNGDSSAKGRRTAN